MRPWFLAVTAALVSCSYDWSPGSGNGDVDGASGSVDGDAGELDGTTGGDASAGCEPGFRRQGDECVDRDECQADNGGCAQVCTNEPGSFTCSCDPGHTLGADGTCAPFVWGEPVLLEARDNAGDRPQVVIDRQGRATVAWVAGFDGVWANRYEPGSGWRGAVAIDTASGNARSPGLAVTDDDTVLLLWDGTATDTSVWAARMLGGSWEAPVQLDTGARLARVATHGGQAAAAWIRIGTERGNLASSRYSATAGWSSARLLETPGTNKPYSVQIALGADDVAHASWVITVDTDHSAWSSHDDGAGTWSAAATIESSAEIVVEDSTLIASGKGGLVVAAWLQAGAGNALNSWASSLKPDGTWAAAEPLRDAEGLSGQVEVLEVGDDGSAWAAGSGNGVWAARYVDGTWGAALPLDDGGTHVDLAIGPTGDVVAAWVKGGDVWSSSYRARTRAWSAPALVEHDNFGTASQPKVAVDGEGHAIVAWVQARDGHGDIWASRLDACHQPDGCDVAWPPPCADGETGDCTCPVGWAKGPEGTCVDVDECALNSDGCDADPDACHNREGGFYCACPNGFVGTGVTDAGCMSNVLDPWS